MAVVMLLVTSTFLLSQFRYGREKKYPDVSQRAAAMQVIGVDTQIAITYHRPGVKGRDVWRDDSLFKEVGKLVPLEGDPRPWRAGANETTTISFEHNVLVEGERLEAGTYALFMIPNTEMWIVVFNRKWKSWGSFEYDQDQDALRVQVRPVEASHQEWLSYGFDHLEPYSARAYLHWGEKKIPFEIAVER